MPAFLGLEPLVPIAHRGGAAERPENSLAAFEHAVTLGYQLIETDARATRDGVCLAFHDAALDRTTDRGGRIRDLPWREVRGARIHGSEPVCRLDDVLAAFPETRFTIDVKESAAIAPLVDAIRRCGAIERVCVGSFSTRRLAAVRRSLPVTTALSPAEVASLAAAARSGRRPPLRLAGAAAQVPESVAGRVLVDARFVAEAARRGIVVQVWTVNDADAMRRLAALGVDGIMTDQVSLLLEVLREHPGSGAD